MDSQSEFGKDFIYVIDIIWWEDKTKCMLDKDVMVTPSLPKGKYQTGQAPLITDHPQTRKEAQNSFAGYTLKWLEMAGNGWKCLEMARKGWNG